MLRNKRLPRNAKIRGKLLITIDGLLMKKEISHIPPSLMHPKNEDVLALLLLDLMEKLRGTEKERLLHLADQLHLEKWTRRQLRSGRVKHIQIGLLFMKHFKKPSLLKEVKRRCKHRHTITRFLAKEVYALTGGPAVVPEVLISLEKENVEGKRQVIEGITRLGPQVAHAITEYLVKTKNPESQIPLIEALTILGKSESIETILVILKKTKSDGVKWAALSYFIHFPSRKVFSIAKEFLKHRRWEFRRLALSIFVSGGAEDLYKILNSKLEDPSWNIRYFVAQQLLQFGKAGVDRLDKISRNHSHPACLVVQRAVAEDQLGLKPSLLTVEKWLPI